MPGFEFTAALQCAEGAKFCGSVGGGKQEIQGTEKKISILHPFPGIDTHFENACGTAPLRAQQRIREKRQEKSREQSKEQLGGKDESNPPISAKERMSNPRKIQTGTK